MIDIVFDDAGTLIPLVLDAVPEEKHEARATATELEVESGAAVSDHYRAGRRMLDLTVVISDTPLETNDAIGVTLGKEDIELLSELVTKDPTKRNGSEWQAKTVQRQDQPAQKMQVWGADVIPQRIRDSWATLMDARDRSLLALINTEWDSYTNMALLDFTATRAAKDGTWIVAQLSFAELRIVSTQTVEDTTPLRPRNHAPRDRGHQQPRALTDAETAATRRSVLSTIFGGA